MQKRDLNPRPLGYDPNALPGCAILQKECPRLPRGVCEVSMHKASKLNKLGSRNFTIQYMAVRGWLSTNISEPWLTDCSLNPDHRFFQLIERNFLRAPRRNVVLYPNSILTNTFTREIHHQSLLLTERVGLSEPIVGCSTIYGACIHSHLCA